MMAEPEETAAVPERAERGSGFSVPDGVALVCGAAVASVHLRDLVAERSLSGFGWAMVWVTFSGIAVSAAGPFVFVVRRFLRRLAGYPRAGDWLWALLGIPWLATAWLRPAARTGRDAYVGCLWVGLMLASLVAMTVVWRTWVIPPPEALRDREPAPWTDRVGLVLAVAWPLQCGFGLVVVG